MGDSLVLIVQNATTMIATLVIAFTANWILALIILGLVPLLSSEGYLKVKFLKGFSADCKVSWKNSLISSP